MRLFGFEVTRPPSLIVAPPAEAPAEAPATRFLGDLMKVSVEDGDVCVLMSPRLISAEGVEQLRNQWHLVFGENVTLIVLDSGMRLGVLSPPQAAAVMQKVEDAAAVQAAVA